MGNDRYVYYWLEPLEHNAVTWQLFSAVAKNGLLLSSLGKGPAQREKNLVELQHLLKKYLPDYSVREDRQANLNVIREFQEYLRGQRREFTLNLCPLGTEFQHKVWRELRKIPYGETRSYSDIAQSVGSPKGQRAVGMANNKNPLGIVVPCHRVIGKNGRLVGYAGGLDIKKMLLDLEQRGRSEQVYE